MFDKNETINQHIRNKLTVVQCMIEYARGKADKTDDGYFETLMTMSQESINSLCELGKHVYETPFSRYYDTISDTEKRPESMKELPAEQIERLKEKNDRLTGFIEELFQDMTAAECGMLLDMNPFLKDVYHLGADDYRHYLDERHMEK